MSEELLIRLDGVSKKFCSNLKKSMKYGVIDIAKDFLGLTIDSRTLRPKEFWSVQDVSFEVRRGECLGLIGLNGAGKSTLLKMVNGIIAPDQGNLEIRGQVGALIEVGVGFHPLLTGRENVYISGAILGLSKKQVDKSFNSIVEFAEIEDFVDTPVGYYSSGMYVRLGFAVAAHMEPDVLLIDEVLAVGDVGFRAKCYAKIRELKASGVGMLIVSHDVEVIKDLCDSAVYLNKGSVQAVGLPAVVVEKYFMEIRAKERAASLETAQVEKKKSIGPESSLAFGTDQGKILQAKFIKSGTNQSIFLPGETVRLEVQVLYADLLNNPSLSIIVQDTRMIPIGGKFFPLTSRSGNDGLTSETLVFSFKARLGKGNYFLTIRLEERTSDSDFFPVDKQVGALAFEIVSNKKKEIVGMVDFEIECEDEKESSF